MNGTVIIPIYANTPYADKINRLCIDNACTLLPDWKIVLGIDLSSNAFREYYTNRGLVVYTVNYPEEPPRLNWLVREGLTHHSEGAYAWLLESDIILNRAVVDIAEGAMQQWDDVGLLSFPTVSSRGIPCYPWKRSAEQWRVWPRDRRYRCDGECGYGNMLLRASAVRKINWGSMPPFDGRGIFKKDAFIKKPTSHFLCQRIREAGYQVLVYPGAAVTHHLRASRGNPTRRHAAVQWF